MSIIKSIILSALVLLGCGFATPAHAGKNRTYDYTPEQDAANLKQSCALLGRMQQAAENGADIRVSISYIHGVPASLLPIDIPLTEEDKANIRRLITRMKPCKADLRLRITPLCLASVIFIGSKGEKLFTCGTTCVTAESKLSPGGYARLNRLTLNDEDTRLWYRSVKQELIIRTSRKMRANTKP